MIYAEYGDLEIETKKRRRRKLNLSFGRKRKRVEVIKIKLKPRILRGKILVMVYLSFKSDFWLIRVNLNKLVAGFV